MARVTELLVNGSKRRIDVDPDRTLLSVLRDDLDLTGAKFGCGEGQCAACTVLIDGVAAKSCLTKIGAVGSKGVMTIEGLAPEGRLHPMQQAFLDADALQCGYCTPGMILGAVALL
jgi:aerobic-type carbon monoxide dehydrogenase small subunit (CoxS/CutS family)